MDMGTRSRLHGGSAHSPIETPDAVIQLHALTGN
jgi:hypothetical protein